MTGLLKTLVSRFLFKNKSKKKFVPVQLSPGEIIEQVFFVSDGFEADITSEHCIVCHSPFIMAVSLSSPRNKAKVQVRKNGHVQAEVSVRLKHTFDKIFVYEITAASCYQLPYWHQYILQKRYFLYKKKDTFLEGMIYAAMYSFPRKVIAVSYKDDRYFNIFPMDFQCFIEKSNMLVLGLRTTNTTLAKILASKKVVVSDTTSVDISTIYNLGRNHSSAPPAIDQLSFEVTKSKTFDFYVPAFSASYREFEIVDHVELGTHTMMIARLVSSEKLNNNQSCVHHIHFFEFMNSDYSVLS